MPTEGLKVTSITLAVKTYRAETIRQRIPTTGNAVIKSRFPKSRQRREAIPRRRTEELPTGTTDSALQVGFVFGLAAYVSTSQHVGRWPTTANVTGSGLLEKT